MVAKTSLGLREKLLLAMLLGLFGLMNTAWAQTRNPDKSFPMVVMIQSQLGFGAGIVIGSRAGHIYIATAGHVVKSGPTVAKDIEVQFSFMPEKYPAEVLTHATTKLDLTVISVTTTGGEKFPFSNFNFNVLGDSAQLERRSDVHALGNPGHKRWGVGLNPDKVDTIKSSEITFQSSYIQKGHSGGALLDSCGDIVGLLVRDSPPNGEALRIESVIQELKSWRIPINIKKSGGCVATNYTNQSGGEVNSLQASKVEQLIGISEQVGTRFESPTGKCDEFYTYLPETGLRGAYCQLHKAVSLSKIQSLVGVDMFVQGPHSKFGFNFDSRYDFGRYNPEFVKGLGGLISSSREHTKVKAAFQPLFDRYFKRQARAYLLVFNQLRDEQQYVDAIRQTYLQRIADKTLPSLFLQESFRELTSRLEAKRLGFELNFYEVNTAHGFWLRRSIDGTQAAFHHALLELLNIYDPGFVFEHRSFGY